MKAIFDHERLEVYQTAVRFVSWATEVIHPLPRGVSAVDHIDRASTSVSLNIAEGNGKSSMRDRCRFLEIAKGSALECAACLDVLVAQRRIAAAQAQAGKAILEPVVRMLAGLIGSCRQRIAEEPGGYGLAFREEERE